MEPSGIKITSHYCPHPPRLRVLLGVFPSRVGVLRAGSGELSDLQGSLWACPSLHSSVPAVGFTVCRPLHPACPQASALQCPDLRGLVLFPAIGSPSPQTFPPGPSGRLTLCLLCPFAKCALGGRHSTGVSAQPRKESPPRGPGACRARLARGGTVPPPCCCAGMESFPLESGRGRREKQALVVQRAEDPPFPGHPTLGWTVTDGQLLPHIPALRPQTQVSASPSSSCLKAGQLLRYKLPQLSVSPGLQPPGQESQRSPIISENKL